MPEPKPVGVPRGLAWNCMVALSSASGIPVGGGGERGVFMEFQPPLNSALPVTLHNWVCFFLPLLPCLNLQFPARVKDPFELHTTRLWLVLTIPPKPYLSWILFIMPSSFWLGSCPKQRRWPGNGTAILLTSETVTVRGYPYLPMSGPPWTYPPFGYSLPRASSCPGP